MADIDIGRRPNGPGFDAECRLQVAIALTAAALCAAAALAWSVGLI